MNEWISENKVTFIVLVGLILFFVCRDLLKLYLDKKIRERLKADMAASEKRIDALMDQLHKDRIKLRNELADVDARFKVLKDIAPNPKNPADVE